MFLSVYSSMHSFNPSDYDDFQATILHMSSYYQTSTVPVHLYSYNHSLLYQQLKNDNASLRYQVFIGQDLKLTVLEHEVPNFLKHPD